MSGCYGDVEIVFDGAEMTNMEVLQQVKQGYRMPNPSSEGKPCPQDLYELMLSCWNKEPDLRPDFGQIVESLDRKQSSIN
ncbi:Ephrin type-A receptor 5 [Cichlidogyrus casuarinus]|uniref:Ephrin type-A receptor 5 n=1 Tax=Cichlidogyrus casuarinus TaxID=1844966 RepID=A0ABD2PK65_9PLAT